MERLTIRNEYGIASDKNCVGCTRNTCNVCDTTCFIVDKLATYEDLEEQGLLLKLPCKVGDTVYVKLASYCDLKYAQAEVRDFTHFTSCGFCVVVTSEKFDKQNIPFSEFGKTVFLTQEQAEKNLSCKE